MFLKENGDFQMATTNNFIAPIHLKVCIRALLYMENTKRKSFVSWDLLEVLTVAN